LFSNSFEQSSLTGQISPLITAGLRDGSQGNVFLAPNDQSSPVDGSWSPSSTSEGDVFSDSLSETSSNWSPSVHSSSPSSPSLSPLNTSFNNIILADDNVQGPTFYRNRSNSYTGLPDLQNDSEVRPRSASFTNVASLGNAQSYTGQADFLNEYNISAQSGSDYTAQDPQISQWSTLVQNETATNPYDPNILVPSFDASQWNPANIPNFPEQPVYPPPPGPPPSQSHGTHGRSLSTHLTVPSLQRRDAHRRSHSHTGIQQDSVRGRPHSSPGPSSRTSSHSRDPSPTSLYPQFDFAPYLNFGPAMQTHQTDNSLLDFAPPAGSPQSDFLSPISTSSSSNSPQSLHSFNDFLSPTSPSSPSLQPPPSPDLFLPSGSGSSTQSLPTTSSITVHGQDSDPGIITVEYSGGVARRHSFGGSRSRSGSRSASPLPDKSPRSPASDIPTGTQNLHRATSDPIGQHRRKPRTPTVPRKFPGLLKPAKEVDEAGPSYPDSSIMINVPIEGVHSAPAPQEFKNVVGSDKIVKASNLRRKNEPRFKCEICEHRFTAKHNLLNHMNSHSNKRPHECLKCGNSFTTRGTHARHEAICSGRPVRKRP
jgi:hypothetical protein